MVLRSLEAAMRHKFLIGATALLLCALTYAQDAKPKAKKPVKPKKVLVPPTAEELKKVEAAIPATLPVQPAKPRRLLVYSESHGFKHNSRLIGEQMLKLIETKTGAFTHVINNEPSAWTAEYLRGFDAILVLNATGLEYGFRKPEQRQVFLDFIKNGGGIAGIHAATDGGKEKWPEYSEMWGGCFGGHPWAKTGTWTIENSDPEHPINASFGGKGFDINDELYRQKHPYKKGNFRTLCCIDLTAKVNTHNPNGQLKIVPSDKPRVAGKPKPPKEPLDLRREYPTSWVKPYGKGRVFYTTYGHNESVYWNPAVVEHYIRGLQYALGDLKVDDTPDPTN
jgi:type 1 glutamine amidotransferase